MSILLPLRVTPGASVRPTVRHTQAAGDCVTRTLSRAVATPQQTRPVGETAVGRGFESRLAAPGGARAPLSCVSAGTPHPARRRRVAAPAPPPRPLGLPGL